MILGDFYPLMGVRKVDIDSVNLTNLWKNVCGNQTPPIISTFIHEVLQNNPVNGWVGRLIFVM